MRSPIEVTQDNKQDDATYAGVEGHCRHRHSRKFVLSGSIHRAERTSAQTQLRPFSSFSEVPSFGRSLMCAVEAPDAASRAGSGEKWDEAGILTSMWQRRLSPKAAIADVDEDRV